jgi:hypothetical protein
MPPAKKETKIKTQRLSIAISASVQVGLYTNVETFRSLVVRLVTSIKRRPFDRY